MSLVITLKYDVYHMLPMFHVHTQIGTNLRIVVFIALYFYNSAVQRNTLQKKHATGIYNSCIYADFGMIYQRILTDFKQKLLLINLLKPTGYETHQQVQHSTKVRCAHNVFVCFVFI
jgi:hypothetical protein